MKYPFTTPQTLWILGLAAATYLGLSAIAARVPNARAPKVNQTPPNSNPQK